MTVVLSPEQEKAILAQHHTRTAQIQADNTQIQQQWQDHKEHYKIGSTKRLGQTETCYHCKAKIPAGTKNVPTKTEVVGDRNHNGKFARFYFCPGGCSQ